MGLSQSMDILRKTGITQVIHLSKKQKENTKSTFILEMGGWIWEAETQLTPLKLVSVFHALPQKM